ncbi:MAG: phosphopentomutase [Chloroflexi bacterium]|nr:phosphopentomutase [Chloroflexota bacterium]
MYRILLLVLDGVGVGALPDAAGYGDSGSNSLANTAAAVGGLSLPTLASLGLGNITTIQGVPPRNQTQGCWGRMAELSHGKDSIAGHWEIAGIYSAHPQPTYPHGFPAEVIAAFTTAIGVGGILGNRPASGTVIIEELGPLHLTTGWPIVYTSADSVFQIAAHEDIVPLATLYQWCTTARKILQGPHAVGRVIARPFSGNPGSFLRTPHRHDWALSPPHPNLLDRVLEAGHEVVAVGKINDLFNGESITRALPAHTNAEALRAAREVFPTVASGLIFVNCIEFDQIYGHRNDPQGYAQALEAVDAVLPVILATLRATDILMIVGDHGVDPTTPSTDHSREYVPLLVTGPCIRHSHSLGTRSTFADAGQTIASLLNTLPLACGASFASELSP